MTAQQTQKAPPTRAEILAAARLIIAKARFSTFVTLGEKGEPRARIVDNGGDSVDNHAMPAVGVEMFHLRAGTFRTPGPCRKTRGLG